MGSGHERGRGKEPFRVGQRVGSQEGVCGAERYTWGKLSSAPGAHAIDLLKEKAAATTGCYVRKAAAPGVGRDRAAAAPGFPVATGSRAQELPKVKELKCTCARSPCPGLHTRGIPGVVGASMPEKMMCCLPFPPLAYS